MNGNTVEMEDSKRSKLTNNSEFIICVSGVPSDVRNFAANVAKKFEGEYKETLDETCTFLIADKVGSKKYQAAAHQHSIPIVKTDFLKACTKEDKIVDFRKYTLGAFAGLTICTTGIYDVSAKEKIIKLIQDNGGTYSGVLSLTETTHLVVGEEKYNGEKHLAAKDWGVKLVTPQWIEACSEIGAWINEDSYQPKPVEKLKTVTETSRTISKETPEIENQVSMLREEEQRMYWKIIEKKANLFSSLRNCILFIETKSDIERNKQLQTLARFCGAMVLWEFSSIVTHLIVAGRDKHFLENDPTWQEFDLKILEYQKRNPSVLCLTPEFLLESIKNGIHPNELNFLWQPCQFQPLQNMIVCVSQYTGRERLEVERICKELGGTFTERFTRENPKVNLLICKGETSEKYRRALEWGVSVQNLEWLKKKKLNIV